MGIDFARVGRVRAGRANGDEFVIGTLRRLGLVLLVGGALLLVTATVGFSGVSADRPTSVTLADDPDAYLGIVENTDTLTVGNDDDAVLFQLNDNVGNFDAGSTDDVGATFVSFNGDGSYGLVASVELSDVDGHDWDVVIACGEETDLDDEGHVTVEITAQNGISITGDRTTGPVEVQCNG